MQIGIIGDIHGELGNLEMALQRLAGVDTIVCTGDLVDKGSDSNGVVKLIRERNIPCVKGNHDSDAPSNERWRRANVVDPDILQRMTIHDENIAFLESLPKTLTFEWEGWSVMLAHGSPKRNTHYIFSFMDQAVFEDVLTMAGTQIVILGHTHEPMNTHVNDRGRILNPGALCGNYPSGSASYGILTLPDFDFTVYNLQPSG